MVGHLIYQGQAIHDSEQRANLNKQLKNLEDNLRKAVLQCSRNEAMQVPVPEVEPLGLEI
jgi:hypothetical protein